MNNSDVQDVISSLIINAFPRQLWLSAQEEMSAGYLRAEFITDGDVARLGPPEKTRFRPQARHYMLNAAFRRAAENCGVISNDEETSPKGEYYVVLTSGGIKITRIGVCHNESFIRSAKHRSVIAELNESFEGYIPDLFEACNTVRFEEGKLGMLLVNINPPPHFPQDVMMDLRVVVPFTNMKGFHFNRSVTELLELYNDQTALIVPDNVIPVLKKRLREQENQ